MGKGQSEKDHYGDDHGNELEDHDHQHDAGEMVSSSLWGNLKLAAGGLGVLAVLSIINRAPSSNNSREMDMIFDPQKPYNELPPLPPEVDVETVPVLKACIAANKALAELKGNGGLIPNQSILINAIPLHEAKDSSEIENIVTTNDKLYQAAMDEEGQHDPQTKEVVRYRTALRAGYDGLSDRPLSANLFRTLCSTIKDRDMDVRKVPGTDLKRSSTGEVIYTPPTGEPLLRELLSDLEKYIHSNDDVDPLIKLAIMHYQFEAIHPFHDGNGRTGRIINILYLVEKGMLELPVLYMSRYLIANKAKYYDLLLGVTRSQSWEDWILFMLEAIEATAIETSKLIIRIKDLFDETCEKARKELPKTVYSKELMELIFEQAYCRIKFLVDKGIAKRQTAAKYLADLEEIGVLKSEKVGKEKIFINPRLVKLFIG